MDMVIMDMVMVTVMEKNKISENTDIFFMIPLNQLKMF